MSPQTPPSDLAALGADIAQNLAGTIALREMVDYLYVAVMRGDPRFCRPEYAKPDFDTIGFDEEWIARGKRVPLGDEIFGDV
jgi:hypothetical protein